MPRAFKPLQSRSYKKKLKICRREIKKNITSEGKFPVTFSGDEKTNTVPYPS